MKPICLRRIPLTLLPLPLVALLALVGACAGSDEGDVNPPPDDGGAQDSTIADTAMPDDASDGGAEPEPEALRCSGDFCLVDLPNPGAYGFTRWSFSGVQVDPTLGPWAIANGVSGIDVATAQMLRFEGDAWKPVQAPVLGAGADRQNIRLASLSTDGAGKLLAVGSTLDYAAGAIVRGDGTTFTTESFDASLEASWFAEPGVAWIAGRGGAIFRSSSDGGWISESDESGSDFVSIWGTGPNDVYVGGVEGEMSWPRFGYLGHRTVDDEGAKWTFATFPELQTRWSKEHVILAGIAFAGGPSFWAAPDVLARGTVGGGGESWEPDPFNPRIGINAFWARSANDIWAVGDIGRIFHFDGTAWKSVSLVFNGAPLVANLTGIAGTSNGDILVVGDGVALRRKAP
ncbi:MAG: hypothetical protein BGO98_26980 [Myxococcales bacterium 68-20]|nr:hypothetical protein [Myxococcales bacterium]OJY30371.1 MAG: hypothetical protein BGO98_26980 [Myxococcales bacterium 68-20]